MSKLSYSARDGAICGENLDGVFNRPLYVGNTDAFVLAGDRAVAQFASGDTLHGTFLIGVARAGRIHWLHQERATRTEFRPAHFRWIVQPSALTGLVATCEIVALYRPIGWAAQVHVTGALAGDELVWAWGGARRSPGKVLNWDLDPHRATHRVPAPFVPGLSAGNRVYVRSEAFAVAPAPGARFATVGRWTGPAPAVAEAASLLEEGWPLAAARRPRQPVLVGRARLGVDFAATFSWQRRPTRCAMSLLPAIDPVTAFAAGRERAASLATRIRVETPDVRLNAAAAALGGALDGLWYPPVYRHGAMLWNCRFPGWRTVFGGTIGGWHERVRAQAKFYTARQTKADRFRSRRADPELLLTAPARDSRFYGRGRIQTDQAIYNMQSQLFDQLAHAWRWTGDHRLARILRPALELHLEWIRECFDPDGDGLYESVINVWPTDSVWTGGGGGAEETAYAFRAHSAARDLARGARDAAAVRRHERALARIRRGFRIRLWSRRRGHAGLYREQGGRQRLHEDAWLYSIFLPIDAGLVDPVRALASLHYADWALQNDPEPDGGRSVWTSNFVPGIWSVRENWPGDNYHLALACFQAGRADAGWDILRGNFLRTAFAGRVPGDFGAPVGGTDFGDCTCLFARALVEGLFGYAPDYPNRVIRIAPQFPESWPKARLRTPDVELRFRRTGGTTVLAVTLARPAPMVLRVPVCARRIADVTVDGRPVRWRALPGCGTTIVEVRLDERQSTAMTIEAVAVAPTFAAQTRSLVAGRKVKWRFPGTVVTDVEDPQGALRWIRLQEDRLTGGLVAAPGHYTVLARVRYGELPQWRVLYLGVREPQSARTVGRPRITQRTVWDCVDLQPVLNADVRTIYQQRYLSPRPATVSIRIGVDGYSPWTFPHWQCPVPEIGLQGVPRLREPGDPSRLRTPQGVPFAWNGETHNIAFTSLWDNWPNRVTVRMERRGTAAWFLVCGSTNPMQGRIANGVLRLRYADGVVDMLELVPPVNYWSLCPMPVAGLAPGQESRADYTAKTDAFCLPARWPDTVQLGANCRAVLLHRRLRPGTTLRSVTLETLSPEVVIGLMGITIMSGSRHMPDDRYGTNCKHPITVSLQGR